MNQKEKIDTIRVNDYIDKFCSEISKHEEHRYNSWVYCREAFIKAHDNPSKLNENCYDYLALHLAFYLASWGMYRGSSFLFQSYTYKVHIKAVEIMMKEDYKELFTLDPFSSKKFESKFAAIYDELDEHYRDLKNNIVTDDTKNEDTSITLITKIIMGVYGCCPAYDTYFRKAISKYGINVTQKGHPNISNLIKNINQNDTFKDKINKATQKLSDPYTKMKVIDIIFWQIGKELIEKEKEKKKNEIKS